MRRAKHQYLLFFYWTVLLADCYFIFSENESIRIFTKGALMPLLLLYYIVNASRNHHLPSRILSVVALILAWAGDLFLLKEGESNFIIGLILFLSMHIAYGIYFLRMQKLFPVKNPMNVWLPFIIIALYDAGLMYFLLQQPEAQKLQTPLLAYMGVLSLMFVFACNTQGSKKAGTLGINFFIPAAVLFIISDSLLGLNKFLWEEHIVGIAVMLTYGYAQQLMVNGFIKHVKGSVKQ